MNFQKITSVIKQNLFFYVIGFCIILGIKLFYSGAGSDELKWILAPTTRLVTLFSGIPFVYESNVGYVNHSLRFLIAPSCSGIQFMNITIATLIFSFVHRICGGADVQNKTKPSHVFGKGLCFTMASIVISYLLTILVNGMRIVLAIYIPRLMEDRNIYISFLTPERLHTAIGTFVYFVSLLTIYRIAGYISLKAAPKSTQDECLSSAELSCTELSRTEQESLHKTLISIASKCISPVFWYLFIVLGIPFLNRAYQKSGEKFIEYTVLVTSVCLLVLLVFVLLGMVHRLPNNKVVHDKNCSRQ